ncbi:hypothetical protein GA0115246_104522 [Streptomyces sp. SolWspMP-sol7th]|nr:hypothetical protein GA0115246_104522 [Streptomyces sp. SolWspMP-sol7th]
MGARGPEEPYLAVRARDPVAAARPRGDRHVVHKVHVPAVQRQVSARVYVDAFPVREHVADLGLHAAVRPVQHPAARAGDDDVPVRAGDDGRVRHGCAARVHDARRPAAHRHVRVLVAGAEPHHVVRVGALPVEDRVVAARLDPEAPVALPHDGVAGPEGRVPTRRVGAQRAVEVWMTVEREQVVGVRARAVVDVGEVRVGAVRYVEVRAVDGDGAACAAVEVDAGDGAGACGAQGEVARGSEGDRVVGVCALGADDDVVAVGRVVDAEAAAGLGVTVAPWSVGGVPSVGRWTSRPAKPGCWSERRSCVGAPCASYTCVSRGLVPSGTWKSVPCAVTGRAWAAPAASTSVWPPAPGGGEDEVVGAAERYDRVGTGAGRVHDDVALAVLDAEAAARLRGDLRLRRGRRGPVGAGEAELLPVPARQHVDLAARPVAEPQPGACRQARRRVVELETAARGHPYLVPDHPRDPAGRRGTRGGHVAHSVRDERVERDDGPVELAARECHEPFVGEHPQAPAVLRRHVHVPDLDRAHALFHVHDAGCPRGVPGADRRRPRAATRLHGDRGVPDAARAVGGHVELDPVQARDVERPGERGGAGTDTAAEVEAVGGWCEPPGSDVSSTSPLPRVPGGTISMGPAGA